jgi:cardiolipin synthase
MIHPDSNPYGGYTSHNTIQWVRGGLPYFDLLEELIDRALKSIHLQVYIYEEDDTGTRITKALVRAAQRGVAVYLLVDGYASRALSDDLLETIKNAGINFRWFKPLLKGKHFYIGRRMHHKIFVADGLHSVVSGRNISNRYNDTSEEAAWLDWAVFVKGETSIELHNRCQQMWYRGGKHRALSTLRDLSLGDNPCFVRVRINDWVRNKNQISRSYQEMFHRAQSEITIMSSYFLPGRMFRKNLMQAAKRGVRISVIMTKISDITLAKMAERYFYPWLLKQGIQIYEYRKKILHGKIATYDGQWVTVGSYNVNNISAYASIELNLDIYNSSFAQVVNQSLQEIIHLDCDRVTSENFEKHLTFFQSIQHRLAYMTFRILFFLFTFYFKQDRFS